MRSVVEKLHRKNNALDRITAQYENRCESCSKCSDSCDSSNLSDNNSQASSLSSINPEIGGSNLHGLHMFGDITRSVIVSSVAEKESENLKKVMLHCFKDTNLNIEDCDIKNVSRIGIYDPNQRWPHPVEICKKHG